MKAFKDAYRRTEALIEGLFGEKNGAGAGASGELVMQDAPLINGIPDQEQSRPTPVPKKSARKVDDDDYDDYDDEGDEENGDANASPLKARSTGAAVIPTMSPSPAKRQSDPIKSAQQGVKTLEDVRKKLEEDKKATEDAAKRSFHTMFYTVENDRHAMLDQQKIEESERQADAELSEQGQVASGANNTDGPQQGSLSSANLGASALTLKNLIARIDSKRDRVKASDAELRSLMSEVRKNRSKWASEDKVGQEELYEAAEKVLSELKAMTEHSTPFLTRVNKRDAPDYYNIIKHPMDLGSVLKKLKNLTYKSKQDFVDDLNLIWANCLKYNANPEHFLRKHALYMRRETEKLVPLIPDIVIRDRAEVEAEERRQQRLADGAIDGNDESDDEPIMSSRGRKAPGKKTKKGVSAARKSPSGALEGTPSAEGKPNTQAPTKNDLLRADSETDLGGSQTGFSTPPPGTLTPLGGAVGAISSSSQVDVTDVDGFSQANGVSGAGGEQEYEDPEYKAWKQVTKKDRALAASERHRLFKGDKLNPEEPALLRRKAGMRRWLRHQKQAIADGAAGAKQVADSGPESQPTEANNETLAEGMEGEEERMLPDYYDAMSAIPDLPQRLRWIEDSEGQVMDTSEDFLRILPPGSYVSPDSKLTKKMAANMRQMQETRKICTKIGVVKQMQLQSQVGCFCNGRFCTTLTPFRCIKTNFRSTIQNHLWKLTLTLT